MHDEIERKFLLGNDRWKGSVIGSDMFRDGLVAASPASKVRVRISGSRCTLTVKMARKGLSRMEFEYDIPRAEAEVLFNSACGPKTVEKTRFYVPHGQAVWEVDIYSGWMEGIAFAEIELEAEDQSFEHPEWLGEEVTGDPRFSKEMIVQQCAEKGRCPTLGELMALPRPGKRP